MSEEREFVTVSREYLMELEQKAKDSEYLRGRVEGMEYVIDSLYEALKLPNAYKGWKENE